MPLKDKGKAHEDRHSREQEFEFMATARRNKLVGFWAAELLGLLGQAAHDYARKIVHSDFEEPGEEDVVRTLEKDLAGKVTVKEIRDKMAHLLHEARRQLHQERGEGK